MISNQKSLVWDLPTRIFHWVLALAFVAAWITHEDNRYLYVHVVAGYLFFGLLIFRLIWGIVGSHYSRFRAFAHNWHSAREYLKALITGNASRHIGHNPAGSWAIFLMLATGVLVSISGLVVLGGEEGHGILRGVVSYRIGNEAKEVHEVLSTAMLLLVILHISGVIVESIIHKENLPKSMITGYKAGGEPGIEVSPFRLFGMTMFIAVIGLGVYAFKGYIQENPNAPYMPFIGPSLPDDPLWREACGECHLAFHPTLLPARSWEKMMDEQSAHFGEDLGLDSADVENIRKFLTSNSAESHLSEPAYKVSESTPPDQTPLRISETPYWKKKHHEIEAEVWKRKSVGNKNKCDACHLDAKRGTFEDSAMRIPNN